jgi:signal peptidase I
MPEMLRRLTWLRLLVGTTSRALVFSVIAAALWMALPTAWGWTATTVMSDSMAPGIRAGDVVVTMPVDTAHLQAGRVVLVKDPDHAGRLRLHRLVAIDGDALTTRGDANPQADSTPVSRSAVVGVAVLRAPWIGAPFVWTGQGRWGLSCLAAGAFAVVLMLCGVDSGVRSRRHVAVKRASAPRAAVAAGAGAVVLVVALAPALGVGAHAAYARSTLGPGTTFGALSSYPCLAPTPADSPTLSFAFNEPSGTSATDGAGANTGTLQSGATRVAGGCPPAAASPYLTLNGTTAAAVTTATVVSAPSSYSIEIWFRTTSATGGRLLGFGNSSTGTSTAYDRMLYLTNAGKVVFGAYNLTNVAVTSPASYNDGAWHHAVATMDGVLGGAGMKLYVDGALVGSNTNLVSQTGVGYWRVGADNLTGWPGAPTTTGLTGSVDDAAVYSSALTAAKVSAHYSAGRF